MAIFWEGLSFEKAVVLTGERGAVLGKRGVENWFLGTVSSATGAIVFFFLST